MAQSGYTPILIYASGTATNVPLAANMTSSASGAELALNYADEKLYFKNSAGVVKLLASNATSAPVLSFSAGTTGLTPNTATTGAVTLAGTLAVANGGTGVTTSTGSGNNVLSTSPTLVTPALGTPSALVGTNITGTASGLTAGNVTTNANLTGAVTSTGNATLLGSFSSANLAGALTDETGTGANVFATSPTLVTPALGTPSSGVVTNLTGTASININGTVGATTASTGAFTSVDYTTTLTGGTGVVNLGSGQFYKDASGRVGIGTSSPLTNALQTLQYDNGTINTALSATAYGGTPSINLRNAGGTAASPIASSSSPINLVGATSSDGTTFFNTLSIVGGIETTPTTGSHPTFFALSTTPLGSTSRSERMRIDSSGNVGIGTSSPDALLTLNKASGAADIRLKVGSVLYGNLYSSASDTNLFSVAALPLILGTNNTERMRIDSSGNVGIGTSIIGTGYRLSVNGTGNFYNGVAGLGRVFFGDPSDSSGYIGIYRSALGPSNSTTAGNGLNFASIDGYTFSTGLSVFGSQTERMRIDSSGNVGIGTNSPTAISGSRTLVVSPPDPATGDAEVQVRASGAWFRANSTNNSGGGYGGFQYFQNGTLRFGIVASGGGNDTMLFTTGSSGTERARIDSSGNLLVGTTTTSVAANGGTNIRGPNSGGSSSILLGHISGTATGNSFAEFFLGGIGALGSIIQNGTTGVLYNVTSDYRLKTVIGPVANAGQRIDALQPVEYTWNASGERTRGFLAHQFAEVYEGSVTGTKDAVDKDGKPVYQAMQASTPEVIADLVAEIQNLRQRLAAAGI